MHEQYLFNREWLKSIVKAAEDLKRPVLSPRRKRRNVIN